MEGFRNIWENIKVALHIQARQQEARQVQQQVKKTRKSEEKEEKKEKATLIVEELKNITPVHKAYDVLQGVNIKASTLAKNESLANDILGILKAPETTDYHDVIWVERKLDAIAQHGQFVTDEADIQAIQKLTENLEAIQVRVNEHKRSVEFEEGKRIEDLLPTEEARRERARKGINADDIESRKSEDTQWQGNVDEILNGIPVTDENAEEINSYKKAINNIKQGAFSVNREGDQIPEVERFFEQRKKEAIKEMGKSFGTTEEAQRAMAESKQKYEKLGKTYEKYARYVIEKNPSLRGRFSNILYGPEGRAVEELIKKDANFRDYWFYQILSPVLLNKQTEPHRELYNLYTAGDMDMFLETVRRIPDEKGNRIGIQIASRYEILKNTVFQSHDMDFYARHPSLDIKEFIGNTSLFLNDYFDAAIQDPMVALSKRAYEYAMLQIRETNNGYIPREWLTWQEGKMRASKLDEMAEGHLKKMIDAGQLKQIKMDDFSGGLLPSPSIWGRKRIDDMSKPITMRELYGYESDLSEEYRKELGDLRIFSALKQAKGLALVDLRLLEIISHSKGTGSKGQDYTYISADNETPFNLAAQQFNSIPYEGIVRHLEPIIHYYTRFSVGGEYYDSFFNMVVTQWPDWKPEHMKTIVGYVMKGDREQAIQYINGLGLKGADVLKTRLLEKDNPFDFSGMWGPSTKWRMGDSTIGFDDWERDQAYGTNIKLMLSEDWAKRIAKREMTRDLEKQLRREYRDKMKDSNNIYHREAAIRDEVSERGPDKFDDEFEAIWLKMGIYQKTTAPDGKVKKYQEIIDEAWDGMRNEHHGKNDTVKFVKKLQKAYQARTWIQAALRHPLLVAREITSKVDKDNFYEQNRPLRHRIIQKLLNIDIDEVAAQRTPKEWEEAGFDRIAEVEGALAAIEQASIRENRDLRDEDFDIVINDFKESVDPKLKAQVRSYELAKQYYHEVKNAMLGDSFTTVDQFYDKIGIGNAPKNRQQGSRFHTIDSEKINNMFNTEGEGESAKASLKKEFETDLLTNRILSRDYNHLFSTEDMGWEYLNVNALGPRNPVRRVGDLASHVQFGQLFEQYLTNEIVARPDIKDLVKAQKEMWVAMNGDSVDQAYNAGFHIAYATAMMWKKADYAWKYPVYSNIIELGKATSLMQVIRGRDRADSWGPNEMLHYAQAVGGQQILPKKARQGLEGIVSVEEGDHDGPYKAWTSGSFGKKIGGTKSRAIWEIGNGVLLFSTLAMTIAAFQQAGKDQEED